MIDSVRPTIPKPSALAIRSQDADLGQIVDVSMIGPRKIPLGAFLTILTANCHNHCGEISCLKGLQGLKGYPM